MTLCRALRTDKATHCRAELSCMEQLWRGSLRGTIQGRRRMPSSPLCIVSDRRGEWSQCEEGAALFPANVPAHVLKRPPCVSKREEMIQNVVFFHPSVVLVIPDGWKMVVIPAILWSRGHLMLLMAPTTPARKPNVTPSITGFHPPHIRPPYIRNPFLRAPGGQGRPTCTSPCVRLSCFTVAFADRSVCCLRWLGSSSQAE